MKALIPKSFVDGLTRRLLYWIPIAMLALMPTMTAWLGNRYQVSVQDLILPVIIALLTATIVAFVFWRTWKRDRLAGIVAISLATLVLASNVDSRVTTVQPFFDAITPITSLGGTEGTVVEVLLVVIVLALAAFAGRLVSSFVNKRGWKSRDVGTGIIVAISITFAIQFLTVSSDLAAEWSQFFYTPPKIAAAPASAKAADKPDIYYIVLEDYANQDVLSQQFGYDNSSFTDYLKDKGYSVDPGALENYPYTTMSVASTLSANYLSDIVNKFGGASRQTIVPFNETIRNAPIAQALQSIGYKYSLVGNWYEAFNLSRVADQTYAPTGQLSILGHTFTLNNFPKIMMLNSIFGRLVAMGVDIAGFKPLAYTNQGDADLAHSSFRQLRQLASAKPGGRFIVADIMVPHEAPFAFNADGSLNSNPNGDNFGEPLKEKYVGDIQYANSQIKGILDQIETTSHGKAVVALLSDEGPQLLQVNDENTDEAGAGDEMQTGDMRKWSTKNLQMKYGTLAAFHLPGVPTPTNANALDSVNIFRTVLNSYFGYSLPYLPNCYYGYPNGRENPEHFEDITQMLTGHPTDSKCSVDGRQ